MNAKNAKSIGFEDGKTYICGFLINRQMTFAEASKLMDLEFIAAQAATNRAKHTYRIRSQHTIDLYVQGVREAWKACQQESQREIEKAERRASITHNPNTRFCSCPNCQ